MVGILVDEVVEGHEGFLEALLVDFEAVAGHFIVADADYAAGVRS